MYNTLGFKWLCEVSCPASAFATADSDEARNPQCFIHVPLSLSVKTATTNRKQNDRPNANASAKSKELQPHAQSQRNAAHLLLPQRTSTTQIKLND